MSPYDVPEIGLVLNKNFNAKNSMSPFRYLHNAPRLTPTGAITRLSYPTIASFQMVPTNPDFSS
ncbi:MAG: hypothetical protein K2P99_05205 [Burkholderiales bacterium]|nr:hypothetical protein [Burkholderiales bacterium]